MMAKVRSSVVLMMMTTMMTMMIMMTMIIINQLVKTIPFFFVQQYTHSTQNPTYYLCTGKCSFTCCSTSRATRLSTILPHHCSPSPLPSPLTPLLSVPTFPDGAGCCCRCIQGTVPVCRQSCLSLLLAPSVLRREIITGIFGA